MKMGNESVLLLICLQESYNFYFLFSIMAKDWGIIPSASFQASLLLILLKVTPETVEVCNKVNELFWTM